MEADLHTIWWETLLRLALALAFGGIVGWDRESEGHAAGLRTHMLVALGAAGLTLMAMEMLETVRESPAELRVDPLRLIEAVIGGVGFLGAGAIIQSRGEIRGLTTAAGLWVVAAVGIAAGAGFYVLAGLMTVLAVVILTVLQRLKGRAKAENHAPPSG